MFINTPIPEWIYFRQVSRLLLSESFSVRRCTLSIGFRVCESPSVNISINPHSVDPFSSFHSFCSGRGRKVLGNFLTWVDLYRVMRDKCNSLDIFILFLDTQLVTTDFHTFKAWACEWDLLRREKKKRMNVNECKRVFFRTLTFEYNMRSCFGFHCVFQLFRFTFVFSINI